MSVTGPERPAATAPDPTGGAPPRHRTTTPGPAPPSGAHRPGRRLLTLLALATLTGALAGLAAVALRLLLDALARLLPAPAAAGTAPAEAAGHALPPALAPYALLLLPALGGLLYGPLVHRYARDTRAQGVADVLLALERPTPRVPTRPAAVRALAAAVCIGTGGSVGRTGPLVQLGGALGSALGRFSATAARHPRTLVACGAAGGLAALFDAPLTGAFFALELLLRAFAPELFGATVLAGAAGALTARAALGDTAFLTLPALHPAGPAQLPLFALLGLAAGVCGAGLVHTLRLTRAGCDRLWRGPAWLRPATGGLLLGALLLALPELHGLGHPVLESAVHGEHAAAFLLLLLLGKAAATALTLGMGGCGGVFGPTLFAGTVLGAAYGTAAQAFLPGAPAGTVGACALAGMATVFAAAARAPVTAVALLLELTGGHALLAPLLPAVALATVTGRLLSRDTVYTVTLPRTSRTPRIHTTAPRPHRDAAP
ncbi:chloride channel protein [Streptomyces sp. JJ36]|uniref:chloride channel protein n=1 Tax=Streptomyces sp. JJ36 TaxID=2736645 RepID=UPI002351B068|nr:chloride channel protein [Streptomyces sp. JJ36]MCF6522234.1 chloride channel protein [Streptomyces sp. JJ36]